MHWHDLHEAPPRPAGTVGGGVGWLAGKPRCLLGDNHVQWKHVKWFGSLEFCDQGLILWTCLSGDNKAQEQHWNAFLHSFESCGQGQTFLEPHDRLNICYVKPCCLPGDNHAEWQNVKCIGSLEFCGQRRMQNFDLKQIIWLNDEVVLLAWRQRGTTAKFEMPLCIHLSSAARGQTPWTS